MAFAPLAGVSLFRFHGPLVSSWTYSIYLTLMFSTEYPYDLECRSMMYIVPHGGLVLDSGPRSSYLRLVVVVVLQYHLSESMIAALSIGLAADR